LLCVERLFGLGHSRLALPTLLEAVRQLSLLAGVLLLPGLLSVVQLLRGCEQLTPAELELAVGA
jgi:hypothetical protein